MARRSQGGNWRSGRRTYRPVRGYTLRGRNGRIRYFGVTNNPGRRASQHKRDGKTGKMRVEKPTPAGLLPSSGREGSLLPTGDATTGRIHP